MSLSSPFIHRPVGAALLTLAIAMAGILSYFMLPVSPLPQVEYPTISVNAGLPGADPETMASSIATPLERQFGRIAGITEMTGSCGLGSCSITLQFDLSRSIDAAARDVQAAINAASGQLPANLPNRPTYRKTNPADAPILILSMTSDIYNPGELYDYGSNILAQKISQVEGVGQVNVFGGALPAVRVEVNPEILNNLGMGFADIRNVLTSANANRPKGNIMNDRTAWSISASDQIFKADDYKPLIIAYKNGAPIRVSDVATVLDSVENTRTAGYANNKPAVMLSISRQPGANIIETVDRIRGLLPMLSASIPPSVDLKVVIDRTTTIRASVKEVGRSLFISVGLVILVVFVFLRSPRATLIPSVAVPVSLIGSFCFMYLLGYSIDNLSLMALAIATGFVVDDAIVVIENITRYLEKGLSPLEAALKGAAEIGFTVLSMSLSLIAVFIPILMMAGIVGRLFRQFAVTLSVAIFVSMVVSLTTTPMMCATLLKPHTKNHGWLYRANQWLFNLLLAFYRWSLSIVLKFHPLTFLVNLGAIALAVYLYNNIPRGFFPQQDTGQLSGTITADQSTSSQTMRKILQEVAKITSEDPAIENIVAFAGGGRGGGTNTANMNIALKPLADRKMSADQVRSRLTKTLSKYPGVLIGFQAAQDIRVGGRPGSAQYQYTLSGSDVKELNEWAPKVLAKMRTIPGITDVQSDQQSKGLESHVTYDRDTASRLGLTPSDIDNALYDAFGQRQVSTLYASINQYHVVMEVEPRFAQDPSSLSFIRVRNNAGALVPLSAFTRYVSSNTPLSITHQGLFPCITLSFNLQDGHSLGEAVEAINIAQNEIGLPVNITGKFAGTAQAFEESSKNMPILIAVAIIAVYIVLGMLYENLIHPITILSSIPSAGIGACLALIYTGGELNLIAFIGIILLIGIVMKNAIMMIDFAIEAQRSQGLAPKQAIHMACLLRFRPILMTTFAALFGGLPLALGSGVGSELRKPLGIAIVGGLIFSQILTLYTTPVVYLYLDHFRLLLRRIFKRRPHLHTEDIGIPQIEP
jgi:multidrug efflux pump